MSHALLIPLISLLRSGDRDYDSMARFCGETFHKPLCSIRTRDHCASTEIQIIESLEAMSQAELLEIEQRVEIAVAEAVLAFETVLFESGRPNEQLAKEFSDKLDQVAESFHYRWVRQLLTAADVASVDTSDQDL
jgi:hypothetical protein